MAIEEKSTEYMDGWSAHKDNCVSGENPYNERTQSYSFSRWLSGWCSRFEAVKHGKSLALDEVYD